MVQHRLFSILWHIYIPQLQHLLHIKVKDKWDKKSPHNSTVLLTGWCQFSCQFSPHRLHVHVLHHCDVMTKLPANKAGRSTESKVRRETEREEVISPLTFYRSVSSCKSPHLLWALLHLSPIVSDKTPSSTCNSGRCICEYLRGLEEQGQSSKITSCRCVCTSQRHIANLWADEKSFVLVWVWLNGSHYFQFCPVSRSS